MILFYPTAIWRPGPPSKVWPEVNAVSGAIEHSAEGGLAGAFQRLDDMTIAVPDRRVSWPFTIDLNGTVYQHYRLDASCWHAGSHEPNTRLVGIEHIGVAGQPLTSPQLAASVTLTRWIAQQGGWRMERAPGGAQTLHEHREINPATTCPNGRIEWGYYLEEAAVQVQALDVSQSIEKVQRFVRQATAVIADQNGDAMFEITSGFPNAQPGYEYICLAMRKDG